jgi:hypothetical protein
MSKATAQGRLQDADAKFLENTGQWDSQALFYSKLKGVDYWVTRDGVTFDFHRVSGQARKGQVVKMRFVGAQKEIQSEGIGATLSRARFMYSDKASKRDAHRYGEVVRKAVYPGVDVRYYVEHDKPRYDFLVEPGARPDSVALKFEGADKVTVEKGAIVLGTQLGEVRHARPVAFQNVGIRRVPVAASYVARKDGSVGIELGNYDKSKLLVVDPVVYGSYYGGEEGWDEIRSIVADTDGGVYMTGRTWSARFPILQGPYSINLIGESDGFVAKLQGDAYANIYAAYFGGSADEYGQFLQLDPFGNLWVAGRYNSPDFPNHVKPNVHYIEQTNADQWNLRGEPSQQLPGRNIATGGRFRITYDGAETTDELPFNATAAQVFGAINALPSLQGQVLSVSGGPLPGRPVRIALSNESKGGFSLTSQFVPPIPPFEPGTEGLEARYVAEPGVGFTALVHHGSRPIFIDFPNAFPFLQILSTFTITFTNPTTGVQATTAAINSNVNATDLANALNALGNKGSGTFLVTGGTLPNNPFQIRFQPDTANPATMAPALSVNSNGLQPKPNYSSRRESDVFVMRWRRTDTGSLDPTDNQILTFGGLGEETLAGFAIRQNDNPAPGEPVMIGFAGTSDSSISEITGAQTGRGYIARYIYANGAFTRTSTQYIRHSNQASVEVGGFAMDSIGNGYVAGTLFFQGNDDTPNNDPSNPNDDTFTVTPGIFPEGTQIRNTDVFVRKYTDTGALVYSGVLGGNGDDTIGGFDTDTRGDFYNAGSAIAVDGAGNAYVTGMARSFNFPRTRGVYGEEFTSAWNVFVTKINPTGSALSYSTNLRTRGRVNPAGIAVDAAGNAFVTGMLRPNTVTFPDSTRQALASSPNQPTASDVANGNHLVQVPGADDPTYTSPTGAEFPTSEGFLNVLNATGTDLIYGTYIGGNLDEVVYGPYVDRFGDVWTFGSVDQERRYVRGTSVYQQNTALPGPFITPLAFKRSVDPVRFSDRMQYGLYPSTGDPVAPGVVGASYARDGFLIKFRVGTTPSVSNLVLNPSTIPGGLGASSVGTVVLSSAAPAGGADVQITLDSTAVASLSPTATQSSTVVSIPAGQTTGTFTVYSRAVTTNRSVQVRATYLGSFLIRQLNVVPWLQSLGLTPNDIIGGNSGTGRITLAAPAPTGGLSVELSSDTPSLVSFPNGATVSVPAGQSTATFTYETQGVPATTVVNISASFEGVNRDATLTLRTANLLSLTFNPAEIAGLGTTTGTLLLDGKAGSTFTVNLAIAGNPNGYTMPSTVTFNAGESSKTFTIKAPIETSRVTRRVVATRPAVGNYLFSQVEGTFAVLVATVKNFTITPATVASGGAATGTVELTSPAPQGDVTVEILFDPNLVTAPATVTVPSGSATVSFPITARVVTTQTVATVTARRTAADAKSATLTIQAGRFGLTLDPASVLGGRQNSVGTVTLGGPAGPTGFTVNLTSSDPSVTVPATVTIAPGQTTATFPITTSLVNTNRQVTITASTAGFSATAELTVRTNGVALLTVNPSKVRGGNTVSVTITLNDVAPAGGQTVTLSSSNASLFTSFPATRTVPAGQKTITFTLLTRRVSRDQAVTITAGTTGSSATASLTITR